MTSASPSHRARGESMTRRFDASRDTVDVQAGIALSELLLADRSARPHLHVERALAHALRSRWDRATSVVRCATDFLLLDPALSLLGQPKPNESPPLSGLAALAIEHAATSELFAALVECAPVSDLRIERLLLALREQLTAALPVTPAELRVAAMIATQARWVEYLWPDRETPIRIPADGSGNARALAALVDAMYRSPLPTAVAAISTLHHESAVRELLTLIRDEPAIEASYLDVLAASGFDATLPVRGMQPTQAARTSCDPPRAGSIPAPVRAHAAHERFVNPRLLLIGCGDAREPVAAQTTWPGARITAIDWSATKLVQAMRTWESAGAAGIATGTVEFVASDVLEIPERGTSYDIVQCTANAHYLPRVLAGCLAIARCTREGSLLRLVIHSEGARRHLGALRVALEERGSVYGLAELRLLREELIAGCYGAVPAQLLEHPDFFTASGMRRQLFAHDDDVPEPSGWIRLVESTDFRFVCVEANDVLTHAARVAGEHGYDTWAMSDWERFERGRPAMFGGEYSLWFVRSGP